MFAKDDNFKKKVLKIFNIIKTISKYADSLIFSWLRSCTRSFPIFYLSIVRNLSLDIVLLVISEIAIKSHNPLNTIIIIYHHQLFSCTVGWSPLCLLFAWLQTPYSFIARQHARITLKPALMIPLMDAGFVPFTSSI